MRYRVGFTVLLLSVFAAVAYVSLRTNSSGTGIAPAASASLIPIAQRPAAPDFTGIDAWINTSPLSLEKLRGKAVLIDFWTFSCVNCVRTLPHLRALYQMYGSQGFVIVGVHSPEFDFEKSTANVQKAVKDLGVTWPVAVDSQMATWTAYGNNVWPAEYLLDQQGRLAYENLGEGNYDATTTAIQTLLSVPSATVSASAAASTSDPGSITPEIYVGSDRGSSYGLSNSESYPSVGQSKTYPAAQPKDLDHALLTGAWVNHGEYMSAGSSGAQIQLLWHATDIYVVSGSDGGNLTARVTIDGSPVPADQRASALTSSSTFTVNRNDLYPLARGEDPGQHTIDITVPAGFQIYTFTFG